MGKHYLQFFARRFPINCYNMRARDKAPVSYQKAAASHSTIGGQDRCHTGSQVHMPPSRRRRRTKGRRHPVAPTVTSP